MDKEIVGFGETRKLKYKVDGEEFAIKLLNYFEKCLESGEKNIGISSTHYYSHQQKLIILGLSHFNLKYPDLKVGIVSFSWDAGHFREFRKSSTEKIKGAVYNYQEHFDLISWEYLLDTQQEEVVASSYDILIWELPEIQFLSSHSVALKKSLEVLNSLFIISNRLKTHDDEAFSKSISQYFLNHGVNISSILPENFEMKTTQIKKKLGRWSSYFRRAG